MSIKRRLARLEALQDDDDIEIVAHMVHSGDGEPKRMTPAEWRVYRAAHPGDWISIREYLED